MKAILKKDNEGLLKRGLSFHKCLWSKFIFDQHVVLIKKITWIKKTACYFTTILVYSPGASHNFVGRSARFTRGLQAECNWLYFRWDWSIGVGGWVVRDDRSCFVDSGSSRRLLLEELRIYRTLHIHEKVSPIKFNKANLSAKYVLSGPLPF